MSQLMHRCLWRKFPAICLTLWLGSTFPWEGSSSVSGSEKDLENRPVASLDDFKWMQNEKLAAQLTGMETWYGTYPSLLISSDVPSHQTSPEFSSKRTSPALVGSVMALLATFEAVDILPPEGTSQANKLIHGLIQVQSVLVKSHDSELSNYVSEAVDYHFKMDNAPIVASVHQHGLTSKLLETLLIYDKKKPIWDQPTIVRIFHSYNISQPDWQLVEQIFAQAEAAYRAKGSSIHDAYEQWRSQMPGERS